MMLLVEIPQRNRVRQHLIQVLDAPRADLLVQRDRQLRDLPVRLDFPRLLVQDRPRSLRSLTLGILSAIILGAHLRSPPYLGKMLFILGILSPAEIDL